MLIEEQKRLVEENIGLIYKISKKFKYLNKDIDLEDIEQMALEGLIRAAKGFNKEKALFSTYAYQAMRTAINRGIPKYRHITCPAHVYENRKENKDNLLQEYKNIKYTPILTEAESTYSGIKEENIFSKDLLLEQNLIKRDMISFLLRAIKTLAPYKQAIIEQRFIYEKTLEETAEELKRQGIYPKITYERVRQCQREALKELKRKINYEKLTSYI